MNKETYLKFRKLELENNAREKRLGEIRTLLSYKRYFKEDKSREAFAKISEYYNILARKGNFEYKKSLRDMRKICSHEVLIPTINGLMCTVCSGYMSEEELKKSIVLDTTSYWLGFDLLETIRSIIDDLVKQDKDVIENFESEFAKRIEGLGDLKEEIDKNLSLRRVR